ncbi:hypothetical protein [Pseudonocardia endophytica]|uniref:Uncharacterized protein n=1 Tax=Pseudonocardia endophytica TaxID=401976 RepID=A0A4R1HXL6_PSEEN|nr:hypothetical protein [Pseudonocardia endophytica]TCK27118.1 hypothetical protein EV378_2976 [Pseudonocardia endophytica]
MTTQTDPATSVEQGALFGEPVTVPADRGAASTAATQDVELVASVLRLAQDPGYRIVERSGRVFRVDPANSGAVDEVPRYEADTVGQLLDGGLLELGGNHTITHRGHTGPARSVLVPKRSREMATRWSNLRPLPPGARQAPKPDEEQTSGPIVVDVVRPGRGLLTCREFGGELLRDNGRYVVETEFGHVVGRASSYRAGAQMLARHHGYRPGPIEIDRREERDGNAPPPRTARDRQLGR